MLTIKKQLATTLPYQFLPNKSINNNDLLLFDIETTGFSPDITSIYLIGCCYYKNESGWQMIQWFADDYISEQVMLETFIEFAKDFKVLVHFNGSGFDIPYIQKKLAHYEMEFDFERFLHIDLYKKIFPYKKVFGLSNLKQKTIEQFLGLPRDDSFSGGELIQVYVNYMKHKFSHSNEMEEDFQKLLLHNEEDVTNLVQLTEILAYCDLFEEEHEVDGFVVNEQTLEITLRLRNAIQNDIRCETHGILLHASGSFAMLQIPLFYGELKYFYPNYKDYYYLTLEDMAIHKSVAEFVDKEYRVKAKAATCYTRKVGTYIPQFSGNLEPSFRIEHKDKVSYIEISENFLQNEKKLSEYTIIILKHILYFIAKNK